MWLPDPRAGSQRRLRRLWLPDLRVGSQRRLRRLWLPDLRFGSQRRLRRLWLPDLRVGLQRRLRRRGRAVRDQRLGASTGSFSPPARVVPPPPSGSSPARWSPSHRWCRRVVLAADLQDQSTRPRFQRPARAGARGRVSFTAHTLQGSAENCARLQPSRSLAARSLSHGLEALSYRWRCGPPAIAQGKGQGPKIVFERFAPCRWSWLNHSRCGHIAAARSEDTWTRVFWKEFW